MKNFKKSLLVVLGILFLLGCANQPGAINQLIDNNPQIAAINNIRVAFGLPNLPLESKGMDRMANSPTGGLSVAIYVDSAGRKFSVEPQTNTVVEMDARNLLVSIPAIAPSIPQDKLKTKAMEIARAMTPNFDSLLPSLTDNSGNKGDNYFFDWRKPISPNETMPPFLQIGIHKSGLIFAYINTLSLK